MTNIWSLDYWKSGEYQVAREKMDDDVAQGFKVNPDRGSLFRALSLIPENKVRVAIIGQDPYPQSKFATGVAFSIGRDVVPREFPPTLRTIFQEYCDDLGYTMPDHGCLEAWCSQGVLLWNAIPSCREGQSLSHDWPGNEWGYLTSEIIRRLSNRGIVFAFLGTVARRYVHLVDRTKSVGVVTSHPSPRGSANSRTPFLGSRLFTTINDLLVKQGLDTVDWRLDGSTTSEVQRTGVDGGRILENVTGASLPGLRQLAGPNTYVGNFEI